MKHWKGSYNMTKSKENHFTRENVSINPGTLGLAMKAGKVVSGEYLTEKAIRDGLARLVIVAEDASANTKKKFSNSCHYYHVPYVEFGNKDMLGSIIGKQFRATLAVTDAGFVKSLSKNLDMEVTEYGENENF